MTRFELTVMHPGGGTFTRTVIAEHKVVADYEALVPVIESLQ